MPDLVLITFGAARKVYWLESRSLKYPSVLPIIA